MVVVGLTGGIGSGKSTVGRMLARRGAVVVEADEIVRQVQAPDGPAFGPIVARFGSGILAPDGTLDRAALAAVVFGDATARADLNRLTHPAVASELRKRVGAHAGTDDVVVLDIPLLAETGPDRYAVDAVVVVHCPVEVAVHRLVAHRGMSEDDARRRVAAQASAEERLAIADFVVDNSGSTADLEAQVERVWRWARSLATRQG